MNVDVVQVHHSESLSGLGGAVSYREFCGKCGSLLCVYGVRVPRFHLFCSPTFVVVRLFVVAFLSSGLSG